MSTRPLLLVLALAGALTSGAPAAAETRSTGRLLLDLARDHGLNCAGRQTQADVDEIKALLEAAIRVAPSLAEAHLLRFELAALEGDTAGQQAALNKLVELNPAHDGYFGRWLTHRLQSAQTVEQRQAELHSLLSADRPPQHRALIHRLLANLAVDRLDFDEARRQISQAVQASPNEPSIVRLGADLLTSESSTPAERVAAALAVVRADPLDASAAWRVAQALDQFGFANDAHRFFQHALSLHERLQPGEKLPGELCMHLALNAVQRGDGESAGRWGAQAMRNSPDSIEIGIFTIWLVSHFGQQTQAELIRRRVRANCERIVDPESVPPEIAAQAAWFYCVSDQQPQRALPLAQSAARRLPGDPGVARVLGTAQLFNGQVDEGRQTLAGIARKDALAAYALAQYHQQIGDEEGARRVVQELEEIPPVGPARDALNSLGALAPTTQPAAERWPEIRTVLETFDAGILEFASEPAKFLAAHMALDDPSPRPGEPWWGVFTLRNTSRFVITLGPDGMLNPLLLLSFKIESESDEEFPHLFTVTVDEKRLLNPGEQVTVRQTLDVGPLRRLSRHSPQQLVRVTLHGILDPVRTAQGWTPGVGGQALSPAYFTRVPAPTDRGTLQALFDLLRTGTDLQRFDTLEVMAELLGEQQRLSRKTTPRGWTRLNTDGFQKALRVGLTAPGWELRVRALDAIQAAGLDAAMLERVEENLRHEHWLVRFLAIRVMARQGPSFAPTASRMAREDPDELVRLLARSYEARWQTAAPATRPQADQP